MDGRGRLKDFAARSLLLKLESRGLVKLPVLRVNYRRARPKVASLEQWEQPADWTATLAEIAPVVVENVQRQLFFPLGRIIVVVQALDNSAAANRWDWAATASGLRASASRYSKGWPTLKAQAHRPPLLDSKFPAHFLT